MENQGNKEKLAKWLNQKWKGGTYCPVCKENDWTLYDQIWELRQFHKGNLVAGGPIIPLAVLCCNNCGNTMNFNAIKLGLVSQDTKEKQEPSKGV